MTLKHPLDPLESQEIEKAVELLKSDIRFNEGSTFISAILDEPDKSIVSDYKENDPIP